MLLGNFKILVLVYLLVSFLPQLPQHADSRSITNKRSVEIEDSLFSRDDLHHRSKHRACSLTPFDVECHGICPMRGQGLYWENLVKYENCASRFQGSAFHCAKNSSGKFAVACAYPVPCNKGKEPIIHYAEGHTGLAYIICEWCSDNRLNPEEGKMSNTYHQCLEVKHSCLENNGEIECDAVTGPAIYWTGSKCRCDVPKNFILVIEGEKVENSCKDFEIVKDKCEVQPRCPDTLDGKKQEYLSSNYSCAPVCGVGFHQRTLDTDECIPIQSPNTTNNESSASLSSVTTATTTSSTTKTTQKAETIPVDETKKNDTSSEGGGDGKVVIVGVVCSFLFVVLVASCVWKRSRQRYSAIVAVVASCVCKRSRQRYSGVSQDDRDGNQPGGQGARSSATEQSERDGQGARSSAPEQIELDDLVVDISHGNNGNQPDGQGARSSAPVQSEQDDDQGTGSGAPEQREGEQREQDGQGAGSGAPEQNEGDGQGAGSGTAEQSGQGDHIFLKLSQDLRRKPLEEADIVCLVKYFGAHWDHLMKKLGLTQTEIDHIVLDNSETAGRVQAALMEIKKKSETGTLTLQMIYDAWCDVDQVNVDWEKIVSYAKTKMNTST